MQKALGIPVPRDKDEVEGIFTLQSHRTACHPTARMRFVPRYEEKTQERLLVLELLDAQGHIVASFGIRHHDLDSLERVFSTAKDAVAAMRPVR